MKTNLHKKCNGEAPSTLVSHALQERLREHFGAEAEIKFISGFDSRHMIGPAHVFCPFTVKTREGKTNWSFQVFLDLVRKTREEGPEFLHDYFRRDGWDKGLTGGGQP